MSNENLIARVLGWLRAGYPEGVPQQDYVALLGILRRCLTEQEVATVAEDVRAGGDADEEAIRNAIEDHVLQSASDDDVRRVTDHLIKGGWPVETDASGTHRLKQDVDA